jgi:hypothetical protein
MVCAQHAQAPRHTPAHAGIDFGRHAAPPIAPEQTGSAAAKLCNTEAHAVEFPIPQPDTEKRPADQGIEVAATSLEQFADFVKAEIAKWTRVVKEAGISAD